MQSSIAKAYDEVVQELIDFKHEIPQLLLLEIGMRGVIYAFGALRNYFHKWNKSESTDTWLPYARWFTKYLNEMYADGWFHNKNRSIRLHITHNAADNIINHKILDSPKAFGALVVIVVGTVAYRKSDCICEKAMWDELWKDFAVHTLGVTLRSGYEKQYASDLRSNNQSWSIAKVKNESKKKAEQAAHLHLGKIETALKKSRKS
jgi:hypothetical protein